MLSQQPFPLPQMKTPFLTLTPQFVQQRYRPEDVEGFLEYVKQVYNTNERKIYLFGTSQGANVAMQFIGKSFENANCIAGVLSPCYNINAIEATNIKNGGVSVWHLQCGHDAGCANSIYPRENDTIAAHNNYEKLKAAGMNEPKNVKSIMSNETGCGGNPHDSWTPTLNSNFRFSSLPTSLNVFEWLGPLTSAGNLLPVTIKAFNVQKRNFQIWLSWQTTQEENGAYFYIQRATDDSPFMIIDSIHTKNISTGATYTYIDHQPMIGNNYYRLLQKDIDGKIQTFEIKKVNIFSASMVQVNQNPFQDFVKFSVISSENEYFQITIRDVQGRVVYNEKAFVGKGKKDYSIPSNQWRNGLYFLSIQDLKNQQTHKLIKQ